MFKFYTQHQLNHSIVKPVLALYTLTTLTMYILSYSLNERYVFLFVLSKNVFNQPVLGAG